MNARRPATALRSGLLALWSHWRLAGILWFSLAVSSLLWVFPLSRLNAQLDQSPFRESVLRGWNSWSAIAFLAFREKELQAVAPFLSLALFVSFFFYVFLGSGVIKALVQNVPGPSLGRVLRETVTLFRPTSWAILRFLFTLVFWGTVIVAGPVGLLLKVAGKEAPPNNIWALAAQYWAFASGAIVLLNVSLRFDLARIALARERTSTARGAYRVAKVRLSGARPRAIGIAIFWIGWGLVIQTTVTHLGVTWNPGTGASLTALVLCQQLGIFLVAATRIGFWASLLRWDEMRAEEARPAALPKPGLLSNSEEVEALG